MLVGGDVAESPLVRLARELENVVLGLDKVAIHPCQHFLRPTLLRTNTTLSQHHVEANTTLRRALLKANTR